VVDGSGSPVAGAQVAALAPEGAAAPVVRADPRGAFQTTTRASEALVLEVRAPGFSTARVEPPLPDPLTFPSGAAVRVVLVREAGRLAGGIERRALGRADRVLVEVEPAVLAPAREAFGAEVVGGRNASSRSARGFEIAGWPPTSPSGCSGAT
jgi:hypothetical protein